MSRIGDVSDIRQIRLCHINLVFHQIIEQRLLMAAVRRHLEFLAVADLYTSLPHQRSRPAAAHRITQGMQSSLHLMAAIARSLSDLLDPFEQSSWCAESSGLLAWLLP